MKEGLTSVEAKRLLSEVGKNQIEVKRTFSAVALFLSQFPTLLNIVLAVAGIFSLIIGDYVDGSFIFAVLVLNGVVGFIQEYRAEKSLEKLRGIVKPISKVLRDGAPEEIPTEEIVPGDVVILSEGDRAPADGTIVFYEDVEFDEAILTGESLPVVKKHNEEVFGGTLVVKGHAKVLIKKTGKDTRFGKIAESLSTLEADKTPLKVGLDKLGKTLSIAAILIAFLVVPLGFLRDQPLFPLIILAISISVAAIPQSLPTVVTVALALGTSRMAKKNAIVRKMAAVETLGSVQIVLVDKTGTITENVMKVKKYWLKDGEDKENLFKAAIFGNTASLILQKETGHYDLTGDKTDGALLLWTKEHVKNLDSLKYGGKVIDEFVFDPNEKTITTVWQERDRSFVFVRGAPEAVIEKSKLSDTEKGKVIKLFEEYAKDGLRVIAFGHKTYAGEKAKKRAELERNLNFLGFVGIYDAPREEAKNSVEKARRAGIRTVMVTGDNELTALTIAKEVGIIEKGEDVLSGEDLKKLSDEELLNIIEKVRVFARSQPEDKLRLVEAFKNKGYIVGVTGDGVNDALALKRADVGVAMGEEGTDVAKEASDIVLTDDNFKTLVDAVEEGRTIYNNIRKAVTYLVSGNISELSLVFFAALLGMPPPLLPTQILWINLVTDGLPALALASDNKNPELIRKDPRDPKVPVLDKKRVLFVTSIGLLLAVSLLTLFNLLLGTLSETVSRTIIFNMLIFSHMTIAFIVRGSSIFKFNRLLFLTVGGTIALQIFITTSPFFQKIFHLGF